MLTKMKNLIEMLKKKQKIFRWENDCKKDDKCYTYGILFR